MSNPDGTVRIRRALVSVYDKTGLDELAAALHAAGVADRLDRVDRGADRRSGRPGGRGLRADRLPRVPRRSGQDAAPEGARRDPGRPAPRRPPRAARGAGDRAVRARRGQPVSRSPRRSRPGPARTSASSRSTSAGRPWSAVRPRTTPSVAVVTSPAAYGEVSLPCSGGGFTLAQRAAAGRRGVRAHGHLRHRRRVVDGERGGADRRGLRVPRLGRRGLGARRRPALRREPAPARRAVHLGALPRWAGRGRAAARQGDVVQQLRRCGRRPPRGVRLRRARPSRSSSTPTRVASRSEPTSPQAHARAHRDRPGVGVRGRHRREPTGHRGDGRTGRRGVH